MLFSVGGLDIPPKQHYVCAYVQRSKESQDVDETSLEILYTYSIHWGAESCAS